MGFHVINTKVEWLGEAKRPASGDALVIPATDHLWMTSGPGLELKRTLGKEIELDAVRQGPVEPGTIVQTEGGASGFQRIFHAAVLNQEHHWVEGAGRRAGIGVIAAAEAARLVSVVIYPLHRGAQVQPAIAARELLTGLIESLERGSTVKRVTVLMLDVEEQALFQQEFLQALTSRH